MVELDINSFSDGDAEAAATEDAKRTAAIDEVIADVQGTGLEIEPEESELIAGKYSSVDEVASALKLQQAENAKLKELLKSKGVELETSDVSPEYKAAEEADTATERADEPALPDPATITKMVAAVHERVGGEAEYRRLQQWAKNNISVAESEKFSEMLQSGDIEAVTRSVGDLQFRRLQHEGYQPTMLRGRVSDGTKPAFESDAAMHAAMRDPRYNSQNPDFDPAYVKEVEGRVRKMLQGEMR